MRSQYKTWACLLFLISMRIILAVEVPIWVLIFSWPLTTEAWLLSRGTLRPSRCLSAYYVSLLFPWELQILSRSCKGIFHSSYKTRCPTLQQPSWMMSMSEGLLLSTKPTVQDGIYPLLLWNPRHSPLPFCVPLLQTSHTLARMVNTLAQMINTMRSFQTTLGSVSLLGASE